LIAGILALALTSCGVFFAPLEGRWNPLDPNFGEGYIEKSLYPTLDGQVYGSTPMPTNFYGLTSMMTDGAMYRALMKFDTGDIPKDIPHAELRLYLTTGGASLQFRVRLILRDWDPNTVTSNDVNAEGFLAALSSPYVTLTSFGFYSWDVTALLQSVTPSSVKGLLVEPLGAGSATFQTTEYGLNKPHLVIWTR
jgi:hypothetical protein